MAMEMNDNPCGCKPNSGLEEVIEENEEANSAAAAISVAAAADLDNKQGRGGVDNGLNLLTDDDMLCLKWVCRRRLVDR